MLDRPIFIVGVGRSGTTLLRTILDRHSAITIPPETHFLRFARKHGFDIAAGGNAARWPDYRDFYAGSHWFGYLDITRAEWLAKVPADAGYREGFAALLDACREAGGTARVGEKTPDHWKFLDTILHWFGDARVIVMVRDPRAMAASQLRAPWTTGKLAPRTLGHGIFVNKRWSRVIHDCRSWRRLAGTVEMRRDDPRLMTLHYEDLVADPERALRGVMDHVGERFEDAMLPSGDTAAPPEAGKEWRRDHYRRSAGRIRSDSTDRWTAELAASDIALIEGICGAQMAALGYEMRTGPVSRRAMRAGARVYAAAAAAEKRLRGGRNGTAEV